MKKITTIILAVIAMCNVVAQRYTQTDYMEVSGHRVKDTYTSQYFNKYPYIGEYRHGNHSRYIDGKLRATFTWNYDEVTAFKVYYENGKVWFQGTLTDEGLFKNYTEYNTKGVIVRQYTMKEIAGKWCYDSYTSDTWKLTCSGKVATVNNKISGASYVYNYETHALVVKNDPSVKFYDEANKAVLKDGMVEFEIISPITFTLDGYGYELNKGTKGTFKYGYKLSIENIVSDDIDNDPTYECGIVNYDDIIAGMVSSIYIPRLEVEMESKYLVEQCKPSYLVVFLGEYSYKLIPKSGDIVNGLLEFDGLIATVKDSNIVAFKYDGKNTTSGMREIWNATKVSSEFNKKYNRYDLHMIEGSKTISQKDGAEITSVGSFKNGKLKEGVRILIDFSKGGDLSMRLSRKRSPLYAKKIEYTFADNKFCFERKDGMKFEGHVPQETLVDILGRSFNFNTNNTKKTTGKYTAPNGNTFEGEFTSPYILLFDIELRDLLNGTANFGTEFGRYNGGYSHKKANGAGIMTVNNLGTITGQFADDKLRKDIACTVDFKLPTGEQFKGKMLGGKFHGKGELICANGDYFKGEFVGGKFSGTGYVRYTHKTGIYEGKVDQFMCVYASKPSKKALKKVKAPKMPKVKIPSKIGKMVN